MLHLSATISRASPCRDCVTDGILRSASIEADDAMLKLSGQWVTLQRPSLGAFRRRSYSIAGELGFHCRLTLQVIHENILAPNMKHPPNISVWLGLAMVDEVEETRNEIIQLEVGFNIEPTLRVSMMLCYMLISDSQYT